MHSITSRPTSLAYNCIRRIKTSSSSSPPIKLSCLALFLIGLVSGPTILQVAGSNGLKVDGWTEVSKGWPLDKTNYFIATEGGHHFINVKLAPKPNIDLIVSFSYYTSYNRVKPVVHMTLCNLNNFPIYNEDEHLNGQWKEHKVRIDWDKCKKRPQFAYHVILHDPGDLFAWTKLQIEEVPAKKIDPEDTKASDVIEQPDKNQISNDARITTTTIKSTDADPIHEDLSTLIDQLKDHEEFSSAENKSGDNEQATTAKPTPVELSTIKQDETTSKLKANEAKPTDAPDAKDELFKKSISDEAKPSIDKGTDSTNEPIKSDSDEAKLDKFDEKRVPLVRTKSSDDIRKNKKSDQLERSNSIQSPTDYDQDSIVSNEEKPIWTEIKDRKEQTKTNEYSRDASKQDNDDQKPVEGNGGRPKPRSARNVRASFNQKSSEVLSTIVCQPNSCNKKIFEMARFTPFIKGVPRKLATLDIVDQDKRKYFLNTKNKPLKLKLESDDESFQEVDTCIRMLLYMDKDTELELLLQDYDEDESTTKQPNHANNYRDRRLELIKRRPTDSTAGKWESFVRCLSDYMPEYKSKGRNTEQSIMLALKPISPFKPDKLVAVILDPKRSIEIRKLYPRLNYLPDAVTSIEPSGINNFWVLDRDGYKKPVVRLINTQPDQERALEISQIDSSQEAFDITSRWITIKDAELIDDPITFIYKVEQAEWIQRIEFQFQRAGDSFDKWISQDAYTSKTNKMNNDIAGDSNELQDMSAETNAVTTMQPTSSTRALVKIPPIKMKGLDSSEFRLRVRHHLKRASSLSPASNIDSNGYLNQFGEDPGKFLIVHSLAFADACASSNRCQNGASCQPTGPTTFDCLCKQGYSGRFCQIVKPCEVIYGTQTGFQICESLGGQCITGIPVMRCAWSNDQYYQCKITKLGSDTDSGASLPGSKANSQQMPQGASNVPLKNEFEGRQQLSDAIDSLDKQPTKQSNNDNDNNDEKKSNSEEPMGGDDAKTAPTDSKASSPTDQSKTDEPLESLPVEEQLVRLKSMVGDRGKLVIILSVFIIAILIFSVVLIGSMVARIRKSKRRLEKSQSDNFELAARNSRPPSTSRNGIFATRSSLSGRVSGAAVTAYNNSAFDVE